MIHDDIEKVTFTDLSEFLVGTQPGAFTDACGVVQVIASQR